MSFVADFVGGMDRASYPSSNILEVRARLGECPLWDMHCQLLYWVDIYNHRVHQFNLTTGNDRFVDVGDVVGCIALAGSSQLIMAQRDCLSLLNFETKYVAPLLSVEADKPGNRFNDGKCDPQGRFWFGSMSTDPNQASLYRYDPDGSLHVMETGLTVSNGLGWDPGGRTFYLTDSSPQKIYAYDFDAETGRISNRRVFVDLSHESFQPDGLTIDSEGCLWSAMWDGWCIIRFDPKGQEITRIQMPVQRPSSCTFGGEHLTDLYVTTASVGLSEQEIQKSVQSGDLFCVKTDVSGLPTHPFREI